jgi:hypothetical protein
VSWCCSATLNAELQLIPLAPSQRFCIAHCELRFSLVLPHL